MKMVDKHFRIVYNHHILKHGGNVFPYFDYEQKNYTSDCIKIFSNTKKKENTADLKGMNAETKAIKDAPEIKEFLS